MNVTNAMVIKSSKAEYMVNLFFDSPLGTKIVIDIDGRDILNASNDLHLRQGMGKDSAVKAGGTSNSYMSGGSRPSYICYTIPNSIDDVTAMTSIGR